ncbi:hypothetical protein [Kitasatospora sp. NPDC088346]|uniref:hypothetical protein n=1 Tax=Kitasatospora sp. NPDC088346 TaxID=3364073 RepID=UPI00381D88D5
MAVLTGRPVRPTVEQQRHPAGSLPDPVLDGRAHDPSARQVRRGRRALPRGRTAAL